MAALFLLTVLALFWRAGALGAIAGLFSGGIERAAPRAGDSVPGGTSADSPASSPTPSPMPINTAFPGLTTFRGNATRSYYGEGPMPTHPVIRWRYPETGGMCSSSVNLGVQKVWCGTGWTGQPNVIEKPDGAVEIRFGAYDGHYHFLNGLTGEPIREDVVTGDLTKGSATSDPDGYPLFYGGSRDNYLRIVALDRKKPTVLWSLNANSNPRKVWNDDWDGAPLIVGDYMLEGGENSWFYVVRLNRRYDPKHRVRVDPKIVMMVPGYDDELLRDLGDEGVSIENSVAYDEDRGVVYFANSGGLVQGWDIDDVLEGGTHYERVFRFWNGDETDASIVIDDEGYLYVGRHASFNLPNRSQERSHEIGSLMKLDPTKPNDPVVWDVQLGGFEPDGGLLGTPALYGKLLYANSTDGTLYGINRATGKIVWRVEVAGPTWGSPVPVDDQLLLGDCDGVLHSFDVSKPFKRPKELWSVELDGCIESTPAVWRGWIWVGSRGGQMYGISDPDATASPDGSPAASPSA